MDPNTELLILVHPSYPWLEETTMRGGRKKALHSKLRAIVRAANFYTPKNTYVVGPLLDDTKDLATRTPENYETLLDLGRTNQYLTGGVHAIGLFTAVEDPAMQAQRKLIQSDRSYHRSLSFSLESVPCQRQKTRVFPEPVDLRPGNRPTPKAGLPYRQSRFRLAVPPVCPFLSTYS